MPCRFRRAFTLIELLIVVAIIAILAALAVPNFLEAQVRAKAARARADMRTIKTALESYAIDWNEYPRNGPANDEMYSFLRLTTPIAYLTEVPPSPFPDNSPSRPLNRNVYIYWRDAHGDSDFRYSNSEQRHGIFFVVSCVAPNTTMDFHGQGENTAKIANWHPDFCNSLYDPTNGTMSYGDLVMTNQRFY